MSLIPKTAIFVRFDKSHGFIMPLSRVQISDSGKVSQIKEKMNSSSGFDSFITLYMYSKIL